MWNMSDQAEAGPAVVPPSIPEGEPLPPIFEGDQHFNGTGEGLGDGEQHDGHLQYEHDQQPPPYEQPHQQDQQPPQEPQDQYQGSQDQHDQLNQSSDQSLDQSHEIDQQQEQYRQHYKEFQKQSTPLPASATYNIYVGNLSNEVEDEDLRAAYEPCGPISSVRVFKEKYTGEHLVCEMFGLRGVRVVTYNVIRGMGLFISAQKKHKQRHSPLNSLTYRSRYVRNCESGRW